MQIGDKVNYLPHEVHSRQLGPDGFAWVFGWRERRPGGALRKQQEDEVEELSNSEAMLKFDHLNHLPADHASREAKKLVMLRPRKPWTATVVAVNHDPKVSGRLLSADLDISDPTTGVTLHYRNVPVDELAKTPHSCHSVVKAKPGTASGVSKPAVAEPETVTTEQ